MPERFTNRRIQLYAIVSAVYGGQVPCWCCGLDVLPADATLEHIKPRALGGTNHPQNLAISHGTCNNARNVTGYRAEGLGAHFYADRRGWLRIYFATLYEPAQEAA